MPDRRSVLGAAFLTAVLAGCAKAKLPTPSVWTPFASRFLSADGRIVDTGNAGVSHSEGQGYGMVLAVAADDRASFERMWRWTEATLARRDVRLYSWRFDPAKQPNVADINNASDGDILIAWALHRAARRWKALDYERASLEIRTAIHRTLVWTVSGRTILLPGLKGFVEPHTTIINPSYYVWPALDAFRKADGDRWAPLLRDGEKLLSDARFGQHQLSTDWVSLDASGTVQPAPGRPPRFGFDAIRVPLYLAWSGRAALVAPYRAFWSRYSVASKPIPAWIDVVTGEVAPYTLSAGGAAVAALVTRRLVSGTTQPEDYYSTVLRSLVALTKQR